MDANMTSLVIISDIRLYRESLTEIINNMEQINVVGSASNIENAIQAIYKFSPDIVLLDMTMIAGSEVIGEIVEIFPRIRVVVLAMTDNEDSILACAKAGVSGYVSREASLDCLIDAINSVVNGEFYCPRQFAASLFNKVKSLPSYQETYTDGIVQYSCESKIALLTQRERQIALLLSDGLSNKQIARSLTIEVSTVKNHVHNILVKMEVESRTKAANAMRDIVSQVQVNL